MLDLFDFTYILHSVQLSRITEHRLGSTHQAMKCFDSSLGSLENQEKKKNQALKCFVPIQSIEKYSSQSYNILSHNHINFYVYSTLICRQLLTWPDALKYQFAPTVQFSESISASIHLKVRSLMLEFHDVTSNSTWNLVKMTEKIELLIS